MLIWEKVHVFRMYIHISIYSVYFFTNQPDSSPYAPIRKTVFCCCFLKLSIYIYIFGLFVNFFLFKHTSLMIVRLPFLIVIKKKKKNNESLISFKMLLK